ncbi:MAG TPA: hypothetical protein PKK00_11635 [Bacteroidales bacterium]|nr:hypothetical protein [Bacteroidales bacterium]HPS17380.1 hypothetical protein [Bacteroidales bacterium]
MEIQKSLNKNSEDTGKKRKNFYVFLFCFIVSSFIWIFVKLSEEYSLGNTYSITFTNVPKGKILINADTLINVKLKSKGFGLLTKGFNEKPQQLNIDVLKCYRKIKNSKNNFFILSNDIQSLVSEQINSSKGIISISPDTLFLQFADEYYKKVPVKLNLKLNFVKQFSISDSMIIYPDSVMVYGTRQMIDSIKYAETVSRVLDDVNSNQGLILKFPSYNENKFIVKPAAVSVFVPVDKYTESKIEVPVVITGDERIIKVKTFPEKVTITYMVPLSKYKMVNASLFNVTADISKAKPFSIKKLKVEITKKPSFVSIKKIEPEKIEYIFLK